MKIINKTADDVKTDHWFCLRISNFHFQIRQTGDSWVFLEFLKGGKTCEKIELLMKFQIKHELDFRGTSDFRGSEGDIVNSR